MISKYAYSEVMSSMYNLFFTFTALGLEIRPTVIYVELQWLFYKEMNQ